MNDTGYSASLPDMTLTVKDNVVAPAQASLETETISLPNARVGSVDGQILTVTNSAAEPAADLDLTLSAGSGAATASGSVNGLAPGASDSTHLLVGLDTATAGLQTGAITLSSSSDLGNGVTVPVLPGQQITVTGAVYREASAGIAAPDAIVHVGDPGTEMLTVTNTAATDGYSENLVASLAGATGQIGVAGPSGEIAPGASDATSLAVSFSTATASVVSGTATVDLTSDGGTGPGSIDGLGQIALPAQDAPVSITVDNYAAAGLSESGGGVFSADGTNSAGGANYTLDLGTLTEGSSAPMITLAALNTAAGPADLLSGSFSETGSSAFTNTLSPFSDLTAGGSDRAGTVTLSTAAAGTFSETITLAGSGSNASGYDAPVPEATLTIEGEITSSAGQTFTLTKNADTFNGGAGDSTIIATSGTAGAGDQINGGPNGSNTLVLQGPGSFNLALPAAASNVQTITAQEGQAAYSAGGETFAAQNQIVVLRPRLDATVNVSPDPTFNPANPKPATITIVGAANSDTINLASGNDVVTVGGPNETVNLGSGNDTINVTAATIRATIGNGTGQNTLDVTGGGTMAMGDNIADIAYALLSPANAACHFTANALSGLTVTDANTSTSDSLVAGAADQILTGGGAGKVAFTGAGAGSDTFKDTAALLNHDTVGGFGDNGDVIDLSDVNSSDLTQLSWSQTTSSSGTLTVSDGVHTAAITLLGQYMANAFHPASDGGMGTAITYHVLATTQLTTPHA